MNDNIGLRDYFAANALQGLLAQGGFPVVAADETPQQHAERIAKQAYILAEAMMKHRISSGTH